MPQPPTAITTSGSKVHVCGSCAQGTRRATEAHGLRVSHGPYVVLGMRAPNSDAKVGVVSDGEFDGNDCASVVVEAVQLGAERAVSAVVVGSNRGGSTTIATRVAIRVTVGRGKRRERPLADPSSSRQQARRSGFEVREDGGDGVVVPKASLIEVAATRTRIMPFSLISKVCGHI